MPALAFVSEGTSWVGPMMKFPSEFAGGLAPSDNSFAATYPGVLGSRVGGAGCGVICGAGRVWHELGFTTVVRPAQRQILRQNQVMQPYCTISRFREHRNRNSSEHLDLLRTPRCPLVKVLVVSLERCDLLKLGMEMCP